MRERTWIEIVVAVAALVVSGISLWVGVRTEDANEQMVASTTWPFVEVQTNNATESGQHRISYLLINAGVGPAKIESFELLYKGKPMDSLAQYLRACCNFDIAAFNKRRHTAQGSNKPTALITGAPANIVLRAGAERPFLTLPLSAGDQPLWEALNQSIAKTTFHVCYCSVLDRCWSKDARTLDPRRVAKCAPAKHPYDY